MRGAVTAGALFLLLGTVAVSQAVPAETVTPAPATTAPATAMPAQAVSARAVPADALSARAAGPDTLLLSLDAAVDRALLVGEEYALAREDRRIAHARYLQARSTALPQLNLSTTYTRQIENIFQATEGEFKPFEADTTQTVDQRLRAVEKALPTSGISGLVQVLSASSFASQNIWNAGLTLTQKIMQGGSVWGSVAAAKHAVKAADAMQADKRADVILGVRQAYLNALLADRTVRIASLGLESAATNLQRVSLRQGVGQASEFEMLQSEVQRDNQVPVVRAALTARETAYLELARLCNLPRDVPVALTSPLLEDAALPAHPAEIDTTGLVESAMRTAGITALEEQLEARRHAITVAAAGKYPDVSAFANVSQQAYPGDVIPIRHDWLRNITAGVAVSWNLFDGLQTKGAIEEAKATANEVAQNLAQARELAREAVLEGRFELERSAADLHARSRTVELSQRALELSNLRYEEGSSSQLEVSDNRIAWQIAQNNEAQARRDYFNALALLERYTGQPLFSSAAAGERAEADPGREH